MTSRLLLILAALGAAAPAYAYDFSITGDMSGVPANPYSAIAPATPAGAMVGSAGVHYITYANLYNKGASGVWLKLYDTATTPTCGSGTPVARIAIPSSPVSTDLAGNNVVLGLTGASFSLGIGYCVTGDIGDADTTAIPANTVIINLGYR